MPIDEVTLKCIKVIVSEAPFLTVESYLDDMFDNPEDNQRATAIQFFRNTPLNNCEFDPGDGHTFTIRNPTNNTSIQISDRSASNEMRGNNLRSMLHQYQQIHPNATIFDALHENASSACLTPLKNMLTGKITPETEKVLSAEQFDRLIKTLSTMLAKNIPNIIATHFAGEQPTHLDFQKKYARIENELWQDIDIKAVSDRVLSIPDSFTASLAQLQEKEQQLTRGGFEKASAAMKGLREDLLEEQNKYCLGEIDRKCFSENCMRHLDKAQNSELKTHRGFLGSLAVNILTFGLSSKAPTDSIKKIAQIKSILQDFVKEGSALKPESPATDSNGVRPK